MTNVTPSLCGQTRRSRRVTNHTFCHSIATQVVADGAPVPSPQEWLGQMNVDTTMIKTHMSNREGRRIRGPADGLARRPNER
jgi:site-specific recombinase XerD